MVAHPHPSQQDPLIPTPPERPDQPSWLDQWPASKRSTIANDFYTIVRQGQHDPATIVAHVHATLLRRLHGPATHEQRQFARQVLRSLEDDPEAAAAYAASVYAREHLPPDEKARLKQAQAMYYMVQAMMGWPATAKQHAYLRSLGYAGELPEDRAQALALIGTLLHGKEQL
jgi:hypothetical protein